MAGAVRNLYPRGSQGGGGLAYSISDTPKLRGSCGARVRCARYSLGAFHPSGAVSAWHSLHKSALFTCTLWAQAMASDTCVVNSASWQLRHVSPAAACCVTNMPGSPSLYVSTYLSMGLWQMALQKLGCSCHTHAPMPARGGRLLPPWGHCCVMAGERQVLKSGRVWARFLQDPHGGCARDRQGQCGGCARIAQVRGDFPTAILRLPGKVAAVGWGHRTQRRRGATSLSKHYPLLQGEMGGGGNHDRFGFAYGNP